MDTPERFFIRLAGVEFDPLHDAAPTVEGNSSDEEQPQKGEGGAGRRAYLVQVRRSLALADQRRLRSEYGLRLVDYVPDFAYLVDRRF